MFTGITEEIGEIKRFEHHSNGTSVEIKACKVLQDSKIGDSIMLNGVCTTITELNSEKFKVDLSQETLNVTTFSNLKVGEKVNLERAMKLSDRFGGHIVSGHIDCVGTILIIEKLNDFYNFKFEIPEKFEKYLVSKGSITVNGVSLTIAKIEGKIFECAIIPHTFQNTVLNFSKKGDKVNIETDILAKYTEKLLKKDVKTNINDEFLKENGFY